MRVFCDLHHNALFHSFQLMGKRVGFEVYRPIGMDWFHEGFFGIAEPYNNALETVRQFLEISEQPVVNQAPAINLSQQLYAQAGLHTCEDLTNETTNLAIELELFKNLEFDVIIATIPNHWEKFKRLRDLYQPKAKLIVQLGNLGWSPSSDFLNILDSTGDYIHQADQHYLEYHQEFNTEVFEPIYEIPTSISIPIIRSFVLDFNNLGLISLLRNQCSGYNWEVFSATEIADFSPITGISKLAEKMRKSLLGLQIKDSDGYGHLVHNWASCGIPLIIKEGYQVGKFARELLIPSKTCVVLSGDVASDTALINQAADIETNIRMREFIRSNFKNKVNFEEEAVSLRDFFANLR